MECENNSKDGKKEKMKQKIKMDAINPNICAVKITVNRLNDPVKRQQCQTR